MIYTGIGSRTTPPAIRDTMITIGQRLAHTNWTLRSGRAIGADQAFEHGCDQGNGDKEIFLPWESFPRDFDYPQPFRWAGQLCSRPTIDATVVVRHLLGQEHWAQLSQGARLLHSRNAHQVLGQQLKTPSDMLICWAKPDAQGLPTGGTRTAWRLAQEYNIKCYNLWHADDLKVVMAMLWA